MEAFLKPLSEAERQVQLLRFAIETQQHAEELRAKREREKDKKKKPGRPFKVRRVDETLMNTQPKKVRFFHQFGTKFMKVRDLQGIDIRWVATMIIHRIGSRSSRSMKENDFEF